MAQGSGIVTVASWDAAVAQVRSSAQELMHSVYVAENKQTDKHIKTHFALNSKIQYGQYFNIFLHHM